MGRKGKKSKKQLEDELLKAAEDQKRHEEKHRLHQLEVDSAYKHTHRLDMELDSKEQVLEAERLEEESGVVTGKKGERQQSLEYEQSKLQDRINWQKFVSCTSRPNVAFESEITTYITTIQEESPQRMEEDAIKQCKESEEIVGDLMEAWCKAKEENDVARQEWCMHYVWAIRRQEIDQIDKATAFLLQYVEKQETNSHSQVYLSWGGQNDEMKVGFWGHLQTKGFRAKQIDFPKIQISLDLPKSIALQAMGQCIGVRSLYTSYDSADGKDDSTRSVGGMIRADLLSIPPFSKRVKGWTIRQVPPPGQEQELLRLPYPSTDGQTANTAVQPCKIEYKVPAHCIMQKSPTVSFWDKDEEKWSTDNITEIAWEPDTRKISFFSQRLAAFSITQERHLDLPYQFWCMRPSGQMQVELKIQASRYLLSFVITEDGLRLKSPDLPELHSIMFSGEDVHQPGPNREPRVVSPGTLLKELRECGLNLMPEDGDAVFLEGYTPKDPGTQARAYSDLSEIAQYYDIASCKHNKNLCKERAMLRIRENPLFEEFDHLDPDCDTDYQSLMFFPDKVCFVQSLEQKAPSEALLRPYDPSKTPLQFIKEGLLPGHVSHKSLNLCFASHPEPTANHAEQMQRLEVTGSTVRFVEAVRQTMQLMRLLCFV